MAPLAARRGAFAAAVRKGHSPLFLRAQRGRGWEEIRMAGRISPGEGGLCPVYCSGECRGCLSSAMQGSAGKEGGKSAPGAFSVRGRYPCSRVLSESCYIHRTLEKRGETGALYLAPCREKRGDETDCAGGERGASPSLLPFHHPRRYAFSPITREVDTRQKIRQYPQSLVYCLPKSCMLLN